MKTNKNLFEAFDAMVNVVEFAGEETEIAYSTVMNDLYAKIVSFEEKLLNELKETSLEEVIAKHFEDGDVIAITPNRLTIDSKATPISSRVMRKYEVSRIGGVIVYQQ